MQVDLDRDRHKYVSSSSIDNSAAFSTDPDIYFDEAHTDKQTAFLHVLQWIRNANNPRAKEIRLQAAFYFFSGGSKMSNKSQVTLAQEIGSTKAAISQQAVQFQDYFAEKLGLKDTMERVSRAAGMRSNEQRQKFSEVCKSNHLKKKSLLSSGGSQTTSTQSTGRPSSLREKVLEAARRQ